ncbi:hypothetical protein PMAYCL1PPCAC_22896, partial [Pristionchus mayeri]
SVLISSLYGNDKGFVTALRKKVPISSLDGLKSLCTHLLSDLPHHFSPFSSLLPEKNANCKGAINIRRIREAFSCRDQEAVL